MIDKYEIRFFQVGNASKGGDAIVIRLYDTNDDVKVVVVDGGYKENGTQIIRYLINDCNLNHIDYVFNTHPDIDHISGLIELFKSDEVTIGKLIMNRPWRDAHLKCSYFKDGRISDNSLDGRLKDNFKKAYDLEQTAIEKIGEDNIVSPVIGNSYCDCITILGPSTKLYRDYLLESDKTPENNSSTNRFVRKTITFAQFLKGEIISWFEDEQTSPINETSIVLAIKLKDLNILLTGDAGKNSLKQALDYYEGLEYNKATDFHLMQLPHHGSRKNINPEILNRIRAKIYVISCPPDGCKEGHFSKRLVNKILEMFSDAKIFTTQDSNWLSEFRTIDIEGSTATRLTVFDEIDE